jgi:two-component system CheB/CheR fusion protein
VPNKHNGKSRNKSRSKSRESGETPENAKRPLIVGIGASAGGLDAFKAFFDHMPADSGLAFVLVQHLDPDHPSILADLLGEHTDMPVAEAEDGAEVAPDHVFIIPPDATLTIEHGCLGVEKPAPARAVRHPIDTFFTSLAADQGENAVCIVLSGAGSDGTLGLRTIKEHGGFALAQEGEDHTAVSGMPRSASATGLVDYCVPVADMPAKLIDYQRHMDHVEKRKDSHGTRGDAADHLETITELVRNEVGHDFSQYKQNTLVRRVQRRMQVLQIDAVPDYIQRLRDEPKEVESLFDDFLIGVTQFFRDPEAWEALEKTVIPKLIEGKKAADQIRVWVPACGTGEEAYSLAILLTEAMERAHARPTVHIFGTDIDERAVEIARTGAYRKALPGLSPERRERWFVADEDDCYRPNKTIRPLCVFAAHNVAKDPPFSKLDLVSCRNLLIYMNNDLQDKVVRKFHYALNPGGCLFLGASEGVSRNAKLFATVDKKYRVFQSRETERPALPEVTPTTAPPAHAAREAKPETPTRFRGNAIERRARHVMEKHETPYVIIDARHEIVHFSGGTIGRYLEPSSGAASFGLLGLVKKALRPAARDAMRRAFESGESEVRQDLPIRIDGEARALTLIVEPFDSNKEGVKHCVVAFQDSGTAGREGGEGGGEAGDVATLEHELRVTRAQLNSTISDLETANEELRSANEEYQSVNEELQSSNEELETSKEEMQSVNEELQTVNAELNHKNDALVEANSDLRNLLESTQIATLFLDGDLCIKNYTPGMRDLFHLREADRGRPITDIVTRLDYETLKRDSEKVLRDLNLIEREVEMPGEEPHTFIMRIRPYRTVDNVIDGVVITFTDITERKRAEVERAKLAALVNSSHDAIIGHGFNGYIQSWNPAAERIFGYTAAEAVGQPMTMLIPEERADEVPELLGRLRRGEPVDKYDVARETRDGGRIDVELTISPVADHHGAMVSASTIARDITARLEHEQHRDILLHELSHRVKNTLATVQSIMVQTQRNASDMEAFAESFGERIQALAKAHGLLTRGNWKSVSLEKLILTELRPYGGGKRWELTGEPLEIPAGQVVPLAIAFHELTTNAAKYGALSVSEGCVEVSWTTEAENGAKRLRLQWRESGGPSVAAPERVGFGTRLIRQGLAHELGADVTLDFAPDGVCCTIGSRFCT